MTETTTAALPGSPGTPMERREKRKIILGVGVGNALEWYDWTAYSIFAAYFAGRSIGGPKLWPRLSPKKTWSGFVGGTLVGTLIALAVVRLSGVPVSLGLALATWAIAALSQGGDLFESSVKRRFAAKDAGSIIPGHGGVMDRLDGFLVAAVAAAALGLMRGGVGNPASGLLVW